MVSGRYTRLGSCSTIASTRSSMRMPASEAEGRLATMGVVQTSYEPRPTDPLATKLLLQFVDGEIEVGSIEPVETNGPNYPNHTILVALPLTGEAEVPARVKHPLKGSNRRRLVALHPDSARLLGRQLLSWTEDQGLSDATR